jgi:hypothetical protein
MTWQSIYQISIRAVRGMPGFKKPEPFFAKVNIWANRKKVSIILV